MRRKAQLWVGLAAVCVTALASACSPATLASLAVSGVSMAATGKGLADHALSGFRDEDCAMLHVFDGGRLCRPYADAEEGPVDGPPPVTVAALAPSNAPEAIDLSEMLALEPAAGPATPVPASASADSIAKLP